MNDAQLRAAVRDRLIRRYGGRPDTLLVEELGLRHGTSRVDLALVNGRLEGFELKSDRDRLTRLAWQADVYGGVLDRVTLIAGQRHLAHALDLVPAWWGVVSASRSAGDALRLVLVRPPQDNPGVDPLALAKLLWREEALQALHRRGAADGVRSARRSTLYERLATLLTLVELKELVRSTLRSRTAWRSDEQ